MPSKVKAGGSGPLMTTGSVPGGNARPVFRSSLKVQYKGKSRRIVALLLTALLLFANVLVTEHAFGDDSHSPTEACSLLHQFDRSAGPANGEQPLAATLVDHVAPVAFSTPFASVITPRRYQSRAPPALS